PDRGHQGQRLSDARTQVGTCRAPSLRVLSSTAAPGRARPPWFSGDLALAVERASSASACCRARTVACSSRRAALARASTARLSTAILCTEKGPPFSLRPPSPRAYLRRRGRSGRDRGILVVVTSNFLHEHHDPEPQGGIINSHERSDQP